MGEDNDTLTSGLDLLTVNDRYLPFSCPEDHDINIP